MSLSHCHIALSPSDEDVEAGQRVELTERDDDKQEKSEYDNSYRSSVQDAPLKW